MLRKMAKSSTSPSSLFRTELLLAVCLLDGALNLAFSPRTTKTTPTARPIMVASPRNSAVAPPPPPPISRPRYSLLSMSPLDNGAPFFVEDEWQQPQGQYPPRDDGAGYKGAPSSVEAEPPSSSFNDENPNGGGMEAYARQMRQFAAEGGGDVGGATLSPPEMEVRSGRGRVGTPSPPPPPPPSTRADSAAANAPGEKSAAASSSNGSSNQPISNVDARVLESILQVIFE